MILAIKMGSGLIRKREFVVQGREIVTVCLIVLCLYVCMIVVVGDLSLSRKKRESAKEFPPLVTNKNKENEKGCDDMDFMKSCSPKERMNQRINRVSRVLSSKLFANARSPILTPHKAAYISY